MFFKEPVFTGAAVVVLALGISTNTTVFSFMNAALLKPLPVTEPDQLMSFTLRSPEDTVRVFSYPAYEDLSAQLELKDPRGVFSDHMVYILRNFNRSRQERLGEVLAEMVSSGYFSTLGSRLALGRAFAAADNNASDPQPVAVISHGMWESEFGGDPEALGQELLLNDRAYTIVGVAQPGFVGMMPIAPVDIWVPLENERLHSPGRLERRQTKMLRVVGRLRSGLSASEAETQLNGLIPRLTSSDPELTDYRVSLEPAAQGGLPNQIHGAVWRISSVFMGVMGLVLLVACANVANLLLARGVSRRREMAIRLALGARRWHLIQQLLFENLLLALTSGAVAVWLATVAGSSLKALLPPADYLPTQIHVDLSVDVRILGFTLLLSLVTALVFGTLPALQCSRPGLHSALKIEAPSPGGRQGRSRLQATFVVAQFAVCLVLLAGAGLGLRSLWHAGRVDLGFDSRNTMFVPLPPLERPGAAGLTSEAYHTLQERLSALPGVRSSSYAALTPISVENKTAEITLEGGGASVDRTTRTLRTDFNVVAPDYFRTMGIPIAQGREFNRQDLPGAPQVAIVNQHLARTLWPEQEAVGRRFELGGDQFLVCGVAANSKYYTPWEDPQPHFYLSALQQPRSLSRLILRTVGDPSDTRPMVEQLLQAFDKRLTWKAARTFDEQLSVALLPYRTVAWLLGGAGLIGLLLASVGVFGLLSYSTKQRTHEIGIRLALGARKSQVLRTVVLQGLKLPVVGIGLGLAGSMALTRLLSSLLFGISSTDPLTFACITGLLLGVALLACYLPARRAASVDPMAALRYE
jgi:predicted permease